MSFLDDAKKKLGAAVDKHGDKIAVGIDKAAGAVDKKTGGKYSDKIAMGTTKAKAALENRDGKYGDSGPGTPGGTGPRPTP